jgi:hypothetical protein
MADAKRELEAFEHGSSGSTADLAVEGEPRLKDRFQDAPASRQVPPLKPGEKPDQLAEKTRHAENRDEARLDEAVEESFPGSDPVSVNIT